MTDTLRTFPGLGSLVVGAVLLASCAQAPVRPEQLARGDYEQVTRFLEQLIRYEMRKHNVTGLSIALVDDQRVVWARGFGYADKAAGIAATPETVYRVGSISKLLTATAAMQLAEQGRLDIDQPLQTYLPEFSIGTRFENAAPITPRTIMSHHSGLPGNLIKGMWSQQPEPFTRLVRALPDESVAFPPNYVFSYSNVGVTLLGHALQEVAGVDFASHLQQSLLQPLGMTQSTFSTHLSGARASKGYRDGKETPEIGLRDVPAGGLNSSVVDLSRLLQMVFADGRVNGAQILRPDSLAEMLRPQNKEVALDQDMRIGLGWMLSGVGDIDIENAGPVAHHGGATLLFRSWLVALPRHKLGVVVLANSSSAWGAINEIATDALTLMLEAKTGIGQSPGRRPVANTDTTVELKTLEGYYSTPLGLAQLSQDGARLRAQLADKHLELVPNGGGLFGLRYRLFGLIPITPDDFKDIEIEFAKVAGRDAVLAHSRAQRQFVGERIESAPIPSTWIARLGEYRPSDPDDFVSVERLTLERRDGFLVATLSMPNWNPEPISLTLMPVSDSHAVALGLAPDMGETIRVEGSGAQERLVFSGYRLHRRQE